MRFLILLPLIASLAMGKSSQGNWSPSKSRNGATTRTAPMVNQARINTSGLSNPNRSITPRPAPVIAVPVRPAPVVASVAPGKINTSSLSDPNRGTPKPAPSIATPVPATKEPVVVNKTVNITVTKRVVVDHRYDSYRHTPAPVIVIDRRPVYQYHGHNYAIIQRGDSYYSNVDGNYVEMTPTGSGWDIVEPVSAPVAQAPIQTQTAPAVTKAAAPQLKPAEESHVGTVLAVIFGFLLVGGIFLWFISSRRSI